MLTSSYHSSSQSGLIRWGIVIHGFIDGYSRLITGMRASPNNRAATVLELFLSGVKKHGLPSRLRGDHGVENLKVAAFMELMRGEGRGSYIWGRFVLLSSLPWAVHTVTPYLLRSIFSSVHNIRIERLWFDVTKQLGAKWADFFQDLELRHGLDINNPHHIWLLHTLFLEMLNDEIEFFIDNWNNHRLQIRGQRSRSPHRPLRN